MVVASLIITGIVNAFSSFFAITLNILTILALRKTPSLPKPMKVLLLSLAVSDLGVGLLVKPLFIALISMDMQQESSNSVLRIFHITGIFFSYASFFGITALSLDRFLAIHLHLRYQELVTHKPCCCFGDCHLGDEYNPRLTCVLFSEYYIHSSSCNRRFLFFIYNILLH